MYPKMKLKTNSKGSSFDSTLLVLVLVLSTLGQASCLQIPKPIFTQPTKKPPTPVQIVGVYAIAPAIPWSVLPVLTDTFKASQNPTDLLTVLIAKRGFIYILATLATVYAGWRASTSLPAGKSLDGLNREILRGEPALADDDYYESINDKKSLTEKMQQKEKEDKPMFELLDEVEGVNQNFAFALPLFLTVALSLSFILAQGTTTVNLPSSVTNNNIDVLALFSDFSTYSNLVVCLLFLASEFRSYQVSDDAKDVVAVPPLMKVFSIPNILALASVVAASQLPLSQAWPFQNSVNIALAVTVTRAIAPFLMEESGSIRTMALALVGLATYDVISVFGTFSVKAAGAFDPVSLSSSVLAVTDVVSSTVDSFGTDVSSSIMIATADNSIMETVARAKLAGPWQPGLLEMVLVGRVSDVIGLGDIVFPACLVSWGYKLNNNIAYAYATIGGYILGSLLTEVVSTFGPTQGLPALIFLTPAMLGTVSAVAIQRGELEKVWGTNMSNDIEPT